MFKVLLLCLLFLSGNVYAYKLTMIQGIDKASQTFITRNGKKEGIFPGKEATFTSNDVSIIATAISVSREFTQWEIKNINTDVPFNKGEVVTFYDTTEYLWALTPEAIKRKYVKEQFYQKKESFSFHTSLSQGLTESVSGVTSSDVYRSGFQFEVNYEQEINFNWAWNLGIRNTEETINIGAATLGTTRFLGLSDIKYYFNPIKEFYNIRFAFGLGFGYGQSQTDTAGLISSGSARILPATKMSLNIPLENKGMLILETALETVEVIEEFENGDEQRTNLSQSRIGFAYRHFIGAGAGAR